MAGGVAVASVFGVSVYSLYVWLFHGIEDTTQTVIGYTALPNLLLVPMGMGLAAASVWRQVPLRLSVCLLLSLLITTITLIGAFFVMKEGSVCLLIVSPLILAAVFAGMIIGRRWFSPRRDRLGLAVLPLLVLLIFAEGRMPGRKSDVVVDRIVIRAAPEEVWKHVVAFPEITEPPAYWLNKIGLPSAAKTTSAGEFVGADRECIFSNGLVFKEKISELESGRLLTFDIVEQPPDPELLGHIDLHRGQFELQPNADGTTTLIGRSWYTLHVRPFWYFNWWTRDITREVHLRVMTHIKRLSENRR